jgi:hypothetical protein
MDVHRSYVQKKNHLPFSQDWAQAFSQTGQGTSHSSMIVPSRYLPPQQHVPRQVSLQRSEDAVCELVFVASNYLW